MIHLPSVLIKANKLKRTVGGQIEPRSDQHVAGLAEVSKLCCSCAASGKRRADIKKKSLIEITTKCNHVFFKEKIHLSDMLLDIICSRHSVYSRHQVVITTIKDDAVQPL